MDWWHRIHCDPDTYLATMEMENLESDQRTATNCKTTWNLWFVSLPTFHRNLDICSNIDLPLSTLATTL